MRNSMVVILALVAALLAGFSLRDSRTARKARIALATARQERDSMRDRVTALESESAELRARAAVEMNSPPPEPTPGSRTFSVAAPRGRMPRPMDALESPEMRRFLALQQKGRLDGRYGALFKALGLNAAQLDQFKQLLVDRQNAAMDVIAATQKQDSFSPGSGSDIAALVQHEQQNVDAAIRELLGGTGYDEYQDFERSRAERTLVEQLASRLSYSETPLTPAQADSLINLLTAERATRPTNANAGAAATSVHVAVTAASDATFTFVGPGGPPASGATITDDSLASAQTVLSETQLAALRELQVEQQAQQHLQEGLLGAMPILGEGRAWVGPPTDSSAATGP